MTYENDTPDTVEFDPQTMSANDLVGWGLGFWAYAKETEVEGERVMGIFGADGEQIGMAPDLDTAFAAIRQHEMEPVRLH